MGAVGRALPDRHASPVPDERDGDGCRRREGFVARATQQREPPPDDGQPGLPPARIREHPSALELAQPRDRLQRRDAAVQVQPHLRVSGHGTNDAPDTLQIYDIEQGVIYGAVARILGSDQFERMSKLEIERIIKNEKARRAQSTGTYGTQ